MNVVRLVVCAVLALPVGWFAGVLIDRVPDRESLLPLPGVRLSGKYLFVQLMMLVLFVLAALRFDTDPVGMLVGYLFLFAMLLTVSVIDVELFRLPDLIVLPSIVVSLVLVVAVSLVEDKPESIRFALAGAGLYFGFLLLAHLVYPRGMGFGDVKLAAGDGSLCRLARHDVHGCDRARAVGHADRVRRGIDHRHGAARDPKAQQADPLRSVPGLGRGRRP